MVVMLLVIAVAVIVVVVLLRVVVVVLLQLYGCVSCISPLLVTAVGVIAIQSFSLLSLR